MHVSVVAVGTRSRIGVRNWLCLGLYASDAKGRLVLSSGRPWEAMSSVAPSATPHTIECQGARAEAAFRAGRKGGLRARGSGERRKPRFAGGPKKRSGRRTLEHVDDPLHPFIGNRHAGAHGGSRLRPRITSAPTPPQRFRHLQNLTSVRSILAASILFNGF